MVLIAVYSSLKTRRKLMKTKFTTHKKQLSALICAALLGFSWHEGGGCQDLQSDINLSEYQDTNSGLLIYPGYTFDGQNGDLIINGVIPSDNDYAIDCTGNSTPFYFGLQNEGNIKKINSITADTIINLGKIEANKITLTKKGNDAYFMNTGEFGTEAEVVLNGGVEVDPSGWVNNTNGAVMTLNGKDAVIGAELANDYGATLNINENTTIDGALWNVEGAILNIADGVTVTATKGFANAFNGHKGGVVNAEQANVVVTGNSYGFSNSETADIGSISVSGWLGIMNSGNLTVNNGIDAKQISNSGILTYKGNKVINGNLQNSGTIYAPQGTLRINGDAYLYGKNSAIWKNSNRELADVEVSGSFQLDRYSPSSLEINSLTAGAIVNEGTLKAKKIFAVGGFFNKYVENGESALEADELIIGNYVDEDGQSWSSVIGDTPSGTIHYGNSVLTVHQKLSFDSSNGTPILENRDRLLFDGDNVVVEGNGKIINQEIYTHWSGTSVGVIAKNNSKDSIKNLTLQSEFINQGEIFAENLSVSKGLDGIEQEDGTFRDSHGFHVDNLFVLNDGDFSLQSTETNLKNLTIGEGGTLHAFKILNITGSLSGSGTLDTGTEGQITIDKASSVGILKGSGVVIAESGAVIQDVGNFTGLLTLRDNSGIGVDSLKSIPNTVTLTLLAGSEIGKASIIVGNDSTSINTASTLTLLDDASLAIVVGDSYDGSSPLITTPSAAIDKGACVYVYNASELKDGTVIINTTESVAPSGYEKTAKTDNLLKVIRNNQIRTLDTSEALGEDVLASSVFSNAINTEGIAKNRVASITNSSDTHNAVKALNNIALMGTASGAQTAAINAANIQLDVIDSHGSVLAGYAHDKSGADLWIDLNGSFSKASRFSAGSTTYGYKSDLAGVTIGSDYAFGNGYAAGVSVSFGTGSVRGQGNGAGIKNEVDYYGVNLYGVWSNEYFNMIGSVGYLQTKNEIKSQGYKGKPDVKVVSAGVRFEKPLSLNESITVTPHVGVRYKHIDMDSFNAGGFNYDSEKANLVEVPFGVAFNANLKAPCGAEVKPFIDLTIAPNFGDRKVTNKVALTNSKASDSFEARIANNSMYNAKLGLNAVKGNHSLGISYGIGSGSYGRVDQALQAKYRYSF